MKKKQFIEKWNPYRCGGSDEDYKEFVKDLDILLQQEREKCAKIVEFYFPTINRVVAKTIRENKE